MVEGAKVTAKVLAQGKAKKVVVFKYKPKKTTEKTRSQTTIYKIQIEKLTHNYG